MGNEAPKGQAKKLGIVGSQEDKKEREHKPGLGNHPNDDFTTNDDDDDKDGTADQIAQKVQARKMEGVGSHVGEEKMEEAEVEAEAEAEAEAEEEAEKEEEAEADE